MRKKAKPKIKIEGWIKTDKHQSNGIKLSNLEFRSIDLIVRLKRAKKENKVREPEKE